MTQGALIRPTASPLLVLRAAATSGYDAASQALRGFTYQALGQLSQCLPETFIGRIDVASRWARTQDV